MIVNEYIDCQHCGNRIANKHILEHGSFEHPVVIVPIDSQIVKIEIQGLEYRPMFSWDSADIGYYLKTKLKCNCCNKHTTIKTLATC